MHPLLKLIRILATATARNMTAHEKVGVLAVLDTITSEDEVWDQPPKAEDVEKTVGAIADEIRSGL